MEWSGRVPRLPTNQENRSNKLGNSNLHSALNISARSMHLEASVVMGMIHAVPSSCSSTLPKQFIHQFFKCATQFLRG